MPREDSEALLPDRGGKERLGGENLRVLAEDLEQCLQDVTGQFVMFCVPGQFVRFVCEAGGSRPATHGLWQTRFLADVAPAGCKSTSLPCKWPRS